jgi:hypothetical protein
MAHEELLPITEEDRIAARDAADRVATKAARLNEALLDRIGREALSPDATFDTMAKAFRLTSDVTASVERAKRQLAGEGLSIDNAPMIVLHMGDQSLSAQGAGDFIEGELVNPKVEDMPELNEEWGL